MCGIAGFLLREQPAELETVRAMCDQIRHRGPDDAGYLVSGNCGIGMRRLSIIDLETGHQPLANEDGSIQVVFNGEIYNYQELRYELISRGHRFLTHGDTEVLVHLYEEWGTGGLSRLRGMFAFCIWDGVKRQILLARDRFGKKPLYYALLPGGLYFASELKALRTAGVPLQIDSEALRFYFQFCYIPDPQSPFQHIRKLPPGGWMIYGQDGRVSQGRYWRLPPPAESSSGETSESDLCDQLRSQFDEAVRIRMRADVPLGAFLSGGIDSSSIVASMALQSSSPVRTFSIGFKESQFNELPYAALVARKYNTVHHAIEVQPDAVNLVSRLVRHFGEPFGDSAAIPMFVLSEFASRYVKVALSGDGGDELFGGYDSFRMMKKLDFVDRVPRPLRRLVSAIADRLPYSVYGKNYLRMISRPSSLERYFENNYAPYYVRTRILTPEWMLPVEAGFLRRKFADCLLPNGASILSQAMYFEGTANLTGDMLVKVDRMSMANSLEVRCPLLDHMLAEFAATIPHEKKIVGKTGKHILMKALGHRIPPEILSRPKMGFGVPLEIWFRGPLRAMLWDHLTSARFNGRGITTPQFVRQLLEEHQTGRRENSRWLWSLLMFELWFRELSDSDALISTNEVAYAQAD
jgi:asparagine synthase (glutamine-hydrolysing)